MKSTLAGIALLGGAALAAASKRRRVQIVVGEIGDDRWMATITGDGTEYLPDDKRIVTAKYGHEALKMMAAGLSRSGFLEGLVPTRTPWLGNRFSARYRGRGQRRPRGQSRLGSFAAFERMRLTSREAKIILRLLPPMKGLTRSQDELVKRLIEFVNEKKKPAPKRRSKRPSRGTSKRKDPSWRDRGSEQVITMTQRDGYESKETFGIGPDGPYFVGPGGIGYVNTPAALAMEKELS